MLLYETLALVKKDFLDTGNLSDVEFLVINRVLATSKDTRFEKRNAYYLAKLMVYNRNRPDKPSLKEIEDFIKDLDELRRKGKIKEDIANMYRHSLYPEQPFPVLLKNLKKEINPEIYGIKKELERVKIPSNLSKDIRPVGYLENKGLEVFEIMSHEGAKYFLNSSSPFFIKRGEPEFGDAYICLGSQNKIEYNNYDKNNISHFVIFNYNLPKDHENYITLHSFHSNGQHFEYSNRFQNPKLPISVKKIKEEIPNSLFKTKKVFKELSPYERTLAKIKLAKQENHKYLYLEKEIGTKNIELLIPFIKETNITTIYGQEIGLRAIPENISLLDKIETLVLSGNYIEKLDKNLFYLKNLKHLKLQYNRIEELPDNFNTLKNLVELDLEKNKFSKLPRTFSELGNLQHLSLCNNRKLFENPNNNLNVLNELKNIKTIDLRYNELSEIPDSLINKERVTIKI